MRASFPLLFALVLALCSAPAWALETELLETNGPSANRIDVAILGDGYTASQQTQFKEDARKFLEYVFSQTPFKEYRRHFNFYLVHVISNESGADMPSTGVTKDTALDATYDSYGIHRLLVVNDTKAESAAMSVPEVDLIFVLVNDPEYGGSGGQVLVASVNELSPEIVAHEIGHTLGDLADEYEDAYPGYPAGCAEANVSCTTSRTSIKWAPWIAADTPLPTPETADYASQVGAFEGARYLASGIWRPMLDCRMRKLGGAFCPICTERLIEEVYSRVSPSDAKGETLTLDTDQLLNFDAKPIEPADHELDVRWSVDGAASGEGAILRLQASSLAPGTHRIQAKLADLGERLRLAAAKEAATETLTWTVTISDALIPDGDADAPEGDAADAESSEAASEEAQEDVEREAFGEEDAEPEAVPDGDLERDADPDSETGIFDEIAAAASGCSSTNGHAPCGLLLLAAFALVLRRRRT